MIQNKPLLYLVAHRMNMGDFNNFANNFIENSMEALAHIVQFTPDLENLKGFECDVKLTKDNVLVVTHEGNIKSITQSKTNKFIRDLTYQELHSTEITDIMLYYHSLIARSYFFKEGKTIRQIFRSRLSKKTIIPKAEDMFNFLVSLGYTGEILVELKNDNDSLETEEIKNKRRDALIELVNAYKGKLNIAIQSYDLNRVLQVGGQTNVRIGALDKLGPSKYSYSLSPTDIMHMPFDFYTLMWPQLNEKMLEAIVLNRKDLYTWTIDSSIHLLLVLNSLEKFKQRHGVIPSNTHLIGNLPLLLNFILIGEQNSKILRSIRDKYNYLYGESLLSTKNR